MLTSLCEVGIKPHHFLTVSLITLTPETDVLRASFSLEPLISEPMELLSTHQHIFVSLGQNQNLDDMPTV